MNFSTSEGSTTSSSQQKESSLSIEQGKILKQRESQFQQYIFPELVNELETAKLDTVDQPTLRAGVGATNRAVEQGKTQFSADVAQRGLEGSGAEVQGLAAIEQGRTSSLSQDFFAAQQAAQQNKMNILQLGSGLAPTPTTAAPILSSSSSAGSQSSQAYGL